MPLTNQSGCGFGLSAFCTDEKTEETVLQNTDFFFFCESAACLKTLLSNDLGCLGNDLGSKLLFHSRHLQPTLRCLGRRQRKGREQGVCPPMCPSFDINLRDSGLGGLLATDSECLNKMPVGTLGMGMAAASCWLLKETYLLLKYKINMKCHKAIKKKGN